MRQPTPHPPPAANPTDVITRGPAELHAHYHHTATRLLAHWLEHQLHTIAADAHHGHWTILARRLRQLADRLDTLPARQETHAQHFTARHSHQDAA